MSRYDVDIEETQYQPGSGNSVLLNKLGIVDAEEMNEVETYLLVKLYEKLFSNTVIDDEFSFQTIMSWHRQWLGNVYSWAGKIRNVRMWKDDFEFTVPRQIGPMIDDFESKYLSQIQYVDKMTTEELIAFIAESHVEFILIHPFREGNGRISRLLIDYMSQEAGYGLLDYSLWDQNKDFYIASIQAGLSGDYQYTARLVKGVLASEC
ncbi:Fic family protein [Vibrio gazogenes]|uniref:protein adenylyltransferase n=1 Tax=Vibrio gazogenes DSM 21264 = NBRC 103151 TaxID=1123492 RepID=A0A1M4SJS9_VIBGA|nr:Fic family protein [Vibrio gazogenes]USP15888.1 Fic family protein [Vibrio gazogenes]SHE32456.1 cell filamentation protein [Vibrio gazogenes DSM 21264] [Vibrio gazogenes DSM 21264 = NBRC 103151]SJN57574.1 Adenosine monophosphate-protein transferase VbhT [Vibrio gazogenes]